MTLVDEPSVSEHALRDSDSRLYTSLLQSLPRRCRRGLVTANAMCRYILSPAHPSPAETPDTGKRAANAIVHVRLNPETSGREESRRERPG